MKKILSFLVMLSICCAPILVLADAPTRWDGPTESSEEGNGWADPIGPDDDPKDAIKPTASCMLWAGCTMDVYGMLGLRSGGESKESRTSVLSFVQDFILAATMFIGTIVTLAFIVSGILMIFAGAKGDSSLKGKATKGMISAIIGMVLVAGSYAIIRLIQFIARGL